MANPAAAAQHQARGGNGAAGRPAAERVQGTSSPWLLEAAPAPAPAQQPRARAAATRWLAAGAVVGRRGGAGAAGAGGRGRGRAASPCTRRCPVVAPAPPPGGRPRCRRPSPGPRLRRRRRVRHSEGCFGGHVATAGEVEKSSVSRGLYNTQNRNPLKRCGDNLCSVEWSGIPCQPRPSLKS
jgi:hypothetical protein